MAERKAQTDAKKTAVAKVGGKPKVAKASVAVATPKKVAVKKVAGATTKPAGAKKPAAKKEAPAKKIASATARPAKRQTTVQLAAPQPTAEERYRMVQNAAYFIAERNGFCGNSVDHWVAAEIEIAGILGQ